MPGTYVWPDEDSSYLLRRCAGRNCRVLCFLGLVPAEQERILAGTGDAIPCRFRLATCGSARLIRRDAPMQSTVASTSYRPCCGYGLWKAITRINGMLSERLFALSVQELSSGHRVVSETRPQTV
jgi:hypothetical protein